MRLTCLVAGLAACLIAALAYKQDGPQVISDGQLQTLTGGQTGTHKCEVISLCVGAEYCYFNDDDCDGGMTGDPCGVAKYFYGPEKCTFAGTGSSCTPLPLDPGKALKCWQGHGCKCSISPFGVGYCHNDYSDVLSLHCITLSNGALNCSHVGVDATDCDIVNNL